MRSSQVIDIYIFDKITLCLSLSLPPQKKSCQKNFVKVLHEEMASLISAVTWVSRVIYVVRQGSNLGRNNGYACSA